jgi:hypothetical protein
MQDSFERRLSQLPMRRAPAHWKHVVLNRAEAAVPRRRLPWNWMALAAAWGVIAVLQWQSNPLDTPSQSGQHREVFAPALSAFRAPEFFLEEILADPVPLPPPRQGRSVPAPVPPVV